MSEFYILYINVKFFPAEAFPSPTEKKYFLLGLCSIRLTNTLADLSPRAQWSHANGVENPPETYARHVTTVVFSQILTRVEEKKCDSVLLIWTKMILLDLYSKKKSVNIFRLIVVFWKFHIFLVFYNVPVQANDPNRIDLRTLCCSSHYLDCSILHALALQRRTTKNYKLPNE